jgi:two-component system nitrogen regulation response regulator GlnG
MNETPTVLLADDDASILTVLTRALTQAGYVVRASEHLSDLDAWIAQGIGDVAITDVTMPRGNGLDGLARWRKSRPDLPVIVMSAHNTLLNAARAQDLGAVTFLPKPFDLQLLLDEVRKATQREASTSSNTQADGEVRISDDLVLIGKSPAMQQVFSTLAKLIGNDLTVLITGASGTGKECIARALHLLSRRKDKPFVALNMAAIPRELIESALFGHEKGAFTGAHQKQTGAFEQATGGTLFLDEIGDMPMEAQTRLLRVLQEQQVTPIGATRPIATDVRVVAATHRNLRALVALGQFREDLYFRLHVVPLPLPSLSERAEDIPLLVEHFMRSAQARGLAPKRLGESALRALGEHAWRGNIRELEHTIYRLCAMSIPHEIGASDIQSLLAQPIESVPAPATPEPTLVSTKPAAQAPADDGIPHSIETYLQSQLRRYFAAHEGSLPAPGLYDRLLARFEKPLIIQTLRATGGNQIKAAEVLGINRNTLRKKMRELNIDTKQLLLSNAA